MWRSHGGGLRPPANLCGNHYGLWGMVCLFTTGGVCISTKLNVYRNSKHIYVRSQIAPPPTLPPQETNLWGLWAPWGPRGPCARTEGGRQRACGRRAETPEHTTKSAAGHPPSVCMGPYQPATLKPRRSICLLCLPPSPPSKHT